MKPAFAFKIFLAALATSCLAAPLAGAGVYQNEEFGFSFTYPENYRSTGHASPPLVLHLKREGNRMPGASIAIIETPVSQDPVEVIRQTFEDLDALVLDVAPGGPADYIVKFDFQTLIMLSAVKVIEKNGRFALIYFGSHEKLWRWHEPLIRRMIQGIEVRPGSGAKSPPPNPRGL